MAETEQPKTPLEEKEEGYMLKVIYGTIAVGVIGIALFIAGDRNGRRATTSKLARKLTPREARTIDVNKDGRQDLIIFTNSDRFYTMIQRVLEKAKYFPVVEVKHDIRLCDSNPSLRQKALQDVGNLF